MGRILNAQRRSMGTVKNRPTVKVPDVSANAAGRDIIDGSKSSQSPGWQYRPCQQAELLMRQNLYQCLSHQHKIAQPDLL